MEEAPAGDNPPQPVPYDIVFTEGLPYDCTCPVCEQALRAPVITPCDHTFCKQCINVDNGPVPCPVCSTDIAPNSMKPNKKKQRQVQALQVKCPFVRTGCEWVGALKEMQKHADSCDFIGDRCSNCHKAIAKRDMEAHLEECQKKLSRCEYCNALMKASSMEKHLKLCPRMIISCPFQCGLMDRPREEIEQHRPHCPNVDNACPFAPLGCTYIGDKTTVQKHLSEEPIRHLMFLCDEVTDLKNYHMIEQSELTAMNERHAELLQKAITANEMYGAQLVWRIDNVTQKKNEARSGTRSVIHSEPFVTGRHGYKFIASACLFGDGQNRGKYMAVYLTLLRGRYDALLDWPFELTICITLLDQNPDYDGRCDISYRVDTRKIKDKSEFLDRPVRNRNGSFGAQTFCRLEVMDRFIRDDTMFIKIEVDVIKVKTDVLKPKVSLLQGVRNATAVSRDSAKTPVTVTGRVTTADIPNSRPGTSTTMGLTPSISEISTEKIRSSDGGSLMEKGSLPEVLTNSETSASASLISPRSTIPGTALLPGTAAPEKAASEKTPATKMSSTHTTKDSVRPVTQTASLPLVVTQKNETIPGHGQEGIISQI